MKQTLPYKSSIIAYYTYGTGPDVVFCLHGYGLDGSCFVLLEESLGKQYTLMCLDLPYHGATDWKEGLAFTTQDLIKIMTQLHFNHTKPFSLLGYSMGGRVVLQALEDYPKLIKQVALVAPDGLRFNGWRHFATHTKVGKRLFKFGKRFLHAKPINKADGKIYPLPHR
jgi:pimeloyl-ACP methyl ester carboxylesterase